MLRRVVQTLLVVLTLLVGTTALVVIVTQSVWFKDWLRGYIVRQADEYLRGQLSISRLGGDLFFGVELEGLEIHQEGRPVIVVKDLGLDYSFLNFLTGHLIFDDVRVNEPVIHVSKSDEGWNLARLVERRTREREFTGPNRPIHVGQIGITDGTLVFDRPAGTSGVKVPERIDKLNARIQYAYRPVESLIDIGHLSFRAASPAIQLNDLSGQMLIESGRYVFRKVAVRTAESALSIDGSIDRVSGRERVDLRVSSEKLALAEIGRSVLALRGMDLQPAFQISAAGPPDAIGVEFAVQSGAGDVNGKVTVDSTAPDRRMRGQVRLGHLNIGPLLKSDVHRSDITGSARIDLRFDARGGPLGPIRGRVDLDASQAKYAQYIMSRLHATTVIEPSRIRIDAQGQAYGGPIATAGTIVPGRAGRPTRFDLKGNVRHVDLRVLPRHLGVPRAATDITGTYHVAGTARQFQVRGTLDESTVGGAQFSPGTLVSLTRDGRHISYTAEGRSSGLNLRRFGRSFGVTALDAEMYESDISGDFRVSGAGTRLDTLAIEASGTIVGSEVLGATVPQLTFVSSLHDRDLQVQAKGQVSGFNPAILRASEGPGKRIPEGELTGTVDVTLSLNDLGATSPPPLIDRLALNGSVILAKSRVEKLDIDEATFTGSYRGRSGDFHSFELKSPSVHATASGPLALNDTGRSDLQYSLTTTDAAALGSIVNLPLAGAVQTSGRLTGNASELTATGQVKGNHVRYDDYRASTLESRYELTLPELSRSRLAVRADTHATAVAIGDRTISDVKAVTSYAEKRLDFEADVVETGRQVQSTGSLTLHPDHREVHFNAFSIASGDVQWMLAPDARPAIRYGLDRLEIDRLALVGPGGDQRLSVDGGFGTGQPGLRIETTNVDLAPIDTILLLKRRLQGRLTASARLTGNVAQPFIEGRFALENGGIGGYTFRSARADIQQQGDVLLVDGVLDQMPGAGLTVKGRLPLALFSEKARRAPAGEHALLGPQMDLHVESENVDLAVLDAFTHRLSNTSGSAKLDAHVHGTLRDPHLDGFLELTDGAFTVVPTAVAYHGIQVRLNFEPDLVRITRFEAIDEHNRRLRLSGELAVHERQVGNLNLLVEAQRFEIVDNQLADLKLDMLLQISGDLLNPRLRGQVELTDGSVNVDEVLRIVRRPAAFQPPPDPFDFSTLPEAVPISKPVTSPSVTPSIPGQVVVSPPRVSQPAEAIRPDQPAPPPLTAAALFKNVEADIRFTMPNNLSLRGTDLQTDESALIGLGEIQAMVGGDISIRKAAGVKPRIIGTINTVRGTYAFQGRRFDILRDGVIRFVGLEEIDPVLNITARREISGIAAQVHIGGTLRTPELTLSSQPPLEQMDILSLIAFNQPANELGAGQRASLAEQAAALGYGFAAGRLTRELGRALELDLLDIQPPSDLEGGGASVTVGQRIGRSTFLRVTQRFGPASSTEVGVEQQLTDFMRLDATGAQGLAATRQIFRRVERAGIDLVFFFSY